MLKKKAKANANNRDVLTYESPKQK